MVFEDEFFFFEKLDWLLLLLFFNWFLFLIFVIFVFNLWKIGDLIFDEFLLVENEKIGGVDCFFYVLEFFLVMWVIFGVVLGLILFFWVLFEWEYELSIFFVCEVEYFVIFW